jgi:hypothetical protein
MAAEALTSAKCCTCPAGEEERTYSFDRKKTLGNIGHLGDQEQERKTALCKCKKVTLSLCTPRRHTGGLDVYLHSFLTSALDE